MVGSQANHQGSVQRPSTTQSKAAAKTKTKDDSLEETKVDKKGKTLRVPAPKSSSSSGPASKKQTPKGKLLDLSLKKENLNVSVAVEDVSQSLTMSSQIEPKTSDIHAMKSGTLSEPGDKSKLVAD